MLLLGSLILATRLPWSRLEFDVRSFVPAAGSQRGSELEEQKRYRGHDSADEAQQATGPSHAQSTIHLNSDQGEDEADGISCKHVCGIGTAAVERSIEIDNILDCAHEDWYKSASDS